MKYANRICNIILLSLFGLAVYLAETQCTYSSTRTETKDSILREYHINCNND